MSDTVKKALEILKGGTVFISPDPEPRTPEEEMEFLQAVIHALGGKPDTSPLLEVQKLSAEEVPWEDFLELVKHMGPWMLACPLGQDHLGRLWSEKVDGSEEARKALERVGKMLAWKGSGKDLFYEWGHAELVKEIRQEQERARGEKREKRGKENEPLELALERVAERHHEIPGEGVEYLKKILKRSKTVKAGNRTVYIVK